MTDPNHSAKVRRDAEEFRRQHPRTAQFDILPDEARDRRHRLAAEGHPPTDAEIEDLCKRIEAAYDALGLS